jgi:hypothetical protein
MLKLDGCTFVCHLMLTQAWAQTRVCCLVAWNTPGPKKKSHNPKLHWLERARKTLSWKNVEQWMIHLAWGLCESEVMVPYTMPITGGTKTQIFTVERDHPQATRLLFSYVAESKRIENKTSSWVCIQYSNLPKSPTSKLLLFCHAVSWTSMLTISLSCQWTVVTSNTSQL